MADRSRYGRPAATGTGVVVVGAIAAGLGFWAGDVDLRTGVVPWAFGALAIGMGLILFGSYQAGIGRPRGLVRWGLILSLAGVGSVAAFFFGMGILAAVGSDLLQEDDTLVSAAGTLVASTFTLLILPAGLLAFAVAVLLDDDYGVPARGLPLVGTLVVLAGPVLVAVLPESNERPVIVGWIVLLAAAWATYGVLVRRSAGRRKGATGAEEIGS